MSPRQEAIEAVKNLTFEQRQAFCSLVLSREVAEALDADDVRALADLAAAAQRHLALRDR